MQPAFFLASASSIDNRSIRLGEPPHKLRAFLLFQFHPTNGLSAWSDQTAALWLPRTLKTAHPDFLLLVSDQFLQFSLWSHLFSILCDQVLDRLVSASFYVTAFTPLTYLLVVFQGSYFFRMGYLFLRWASRLDAFSVYPLRISLPSCALGRTTVAPVMRPLRSSRTRSSSSHVSFAHDG